MAFSSEAHRQAIIIKKDYFSMADDERFADTLWHELRPYVAARAESPELKKLLD